MATQSITRPGEALATSCDKATPVPMAGVLSILSVALALLAAVAAATRLLAPAVYRDAPSWVAQARGQDLVTLVVVVPLMLAAQVGARRGSTRAFLVWLGCVGFIAYSYAIYAFSAHFNSLFLVYVATFGIGTYTLVFGLAKLMRQARIVSAQIERWGDPDNSGVWGMHPFGFEATACATFDGVSVPSQGRVGWFPRTEQWADGEFFRFALTELRRVTA